MGLVLSMAAPDRLDPDVRNEFEQFGGAIQVWSGQVDGTGKWNDLPYTAASYGQNRGVWGVTQGGQKSYRYALVGNTMHLQVYLIDTTTSAAVDEELHVYIPSGFVVDTTGTAPVFVGTVMFLDNTGIVSGTGLVMINFTDNDPTPNNRRLTLIRNLSGTGWPSSSTSMVVALFATIPVLKV